jgi:hypothetical protein
MKKIVKQIGIALLVLAMVFSMAACGGGDDSGGDSTPTADNFEFGNLSQLVGNVTPVTITPNAGTNITGAITIYYAGSTTLPSAANSYAVTFDVAASSGWKETKGLSAGTLTIRGPLTSVAELFTWLNSAPASTITKPYNIPLNVASLGGKSTISGSVGNILYAYRTTKYINLDLSGSTLTTIEGQAFYDCTSLISVTIPNSDTSIEQSAFEGCSSLTSITIPASDTNINILAFVGCTSLTSVTFGGASTTIANDNSFPSGASLRSVYPSQGAGTYTLNGTTWSKQP